MRALLDPQAVIAIHAQRVQDFAAFLIEGVPDKFLNGREHAGHQIRIPGSRRVGRDMVEHQSGFAMDQIDLFNAINQCVQ